MNSVLQVAWIHTDKHTLLTLHERVITRNTRYSISHNSFRTWWLTIKDVDESDKGEFMCQINTSPMMSQSGYLDVVGKSCYKFCQKSLFCVV
ncbi:ig domain-containing protein [Trichonephila clavata]|uniref:Ig domain-containing protein n=1 Tax=Trichonephila clavata TaxID=2740835 RepID=A0A8X6F5E6_TRICU|nr:ig domain-containing protein [Trichonephila clavata]